MRELDFLLTRFLNECYPQLDSDGQAGFAALLECQDPDILDWLMQRRDDYPSECTQVVRLLITSN
ncbi:MAG: hypothetical protein DHS20C01_16730 [marine bacterium B5-7]|nr:MAG: hypothetical protein DHS20C01_16730 [marine bacterium B5-7]